MLENVLILGEIGRAAFEEDGGLFVLAVDAEHPVRCRAGEVSLLLDSGAEAEEFAQFPDVARLREELRQKHVRHRALSFALSGLDPDFSDATRTLCIEAAEELCADAAVRDFVHDRLLARPLPEEAEITTAIECAKLSESREIRGIYESVADSQDAVRTVNESWLAIALQHFATESDQLAAEKVLVDRGILGAMTIALARGDKRELNSVAFSGSTDAGLKQQFPRIAFVLTALSNSLIEAAGDRLVTSAETIIPEPQVSSAEDEAPPGEGADPIQLLLAGISDEDRDWKGFRDSRAIHTKVRKQIEAVTGAISRGDLDRAELYLFDLVDYQVRNDRREHIAKTLSLLAQVALEAQRPELAQRLVGYCKLVHSIDPVVSTQQGLLLRRSGQLVDALDAYDQSIARFPDNVVARTGRAEVLKEMGRLPDALAAYDETIARFPDDVVARNGRAEVLKEMGRLPNALDAYNETIAHFPDNAVARNGRAEVLKEMGRLPDALDAYDEAIVHFPDDAFARTGRAEVLKEMGRMPDALAAYGEAVARFPDNAVARAGRVEVLKEMGRLPDALDAYDEAVARFPYNAVARNGRAEVLKEMGRLPDALDAYDETIVRFPDDVFARNGRAEVLKETGRLPDALDAYDETIARFPYNAVARNGRAEVLKVMGRLLDALAAYDETIARFPDDVFARNGRATALILSDRVAEARATLPQASPVTKQDWIGYHILCMSYLRHSELDEAIKRLRHGVEAVPWKRIRVYFERALALALIRKREFEAAAKVLHEEALIVEAARSQVSLLLLAHSNAEMGRRSEALGNVMQLARSAGPDLRMLQSALMSRYQLASPTTTQPPPALSWLDTDIADREFKLVLATA